MDKQLAISELREIQKQLRSKQFRSDLQFRIDVSSKIPPLVAFDDYYKNQATKATFVLTKTGFSNELYKNQTLGLDSIITQAITKLETNLVVIPQQNQSVAEIKYPDRITFNWLKNHVPLSMWSWFFGLLIASFCLGISLSTTNLYKNLAISPTQRENAMTEAKSIPPKTDANNVEKKSTIIQ